MMESVEKRMCPSENMTDKFVEKSPAVKKAKDYSKEYRERLKSDPELNKLHRAAETLVLKYTEKEIKVKMRNKEIESFKGSDKRSTEKD